ncbi:MAG: hypothetical protein JWM68_710 [Verrucomicrobiales bacterium]|nr:hypothetical protein [Verrucomicrobiales bacterium]
MNKLRRLHLYLGCFFAPMLLFFIATGWYQTVNPDRRKGVGDSDTIVSRLNRVHVEQYFPTDTAQGYSTKWFTWLVVAMSVALIATTVLGLILAFRFSKKKLPVYLSLVLGIALPMLILWLSQKK